MGGAEGDTFFGGGGSDRFILSGAANWVMDFEPGTDRLEVPGLTTDTALRASADQAGEHVRIGFDGGELYLAWTTVGALDWVDLLV